MNYKEDKEIAKLINHLKEINKQMDNPNEKIRDVLINIQNDYSVESGIIERINANWDNSKITNINNIGIATLYGKLPIYKTFCLEKLSQKVSKELYNEILKFEGII